MSISLSSLVYPYFVVSGINRKEEIKNFPGVFHFSIDQLLKDISKSKALGLNKVLLFGLADKKDNLGK